jgi:xanthine dehydrogenase YagS FAD-binding subunit
VRLFQYVRAADRAGAIGSFGPGAMYLAGGTDLLQLLKGNVASPDRLIDLSHLPDFDRIERLPDGRLMIGALARMADVARSPLVRDAWPLVSQALLLSASAQVRNAATVAGNLLQRTRCPYFRDATMPCNKRAPGTGCPARAGEHRNHAIFGTSEYCMAANASDLAVALTALDAVLHVHGAAGVRKVPIADLYQLPGDRPDREVSLADGDFIAAIELPPQTVPASCQRYTKVRDRQSFEFAVVSVACALAMNSDGVVRAAHLAAGGVGTRPWRLSAVEALIEGQRPDVALFDKAGEVATEGAQPGPQNRFKVGLLETLVTRVLVEVSGES